MIRAVFCVFFIQMAKWFKLTRGRHCQFLESFRAVRDAFNAVLTITRRIGPPLPILTRKHLISHSSVRDTRLASTTVWQHVCSHSHLVITPARKLKITYIYLI